MVLIFSDAGFNLGFALAQVNSLTPGTYVVMNGQVLLVKMPLKLLVRVVLPRFYF